MRESGVLLPISSLPSDYGIGCFSKEAYEFVDFLAQAGQKLWQVLPMGQTSYGDSPYQSFSTFAGNPYFIDLEQLIEEGLLKKEECDAYDFGQNASCVDYGLLFTNRSKVLHQAYDRFEENQAYEKFVKENLAWLKEYGTYMTIKSAYNYVSWDQWPKKYKMRDENAIAAFIKENEQEIKYYYFLQYEFSKQWNKLRAYANKNGISIIGDIPIYIAYDSADAWSNPSLFAFDEERRPIEVAGCPPDAFSETGQLWGNPIYNWEYHKKDEFRWWVNRMKQCMEMYDIVRIDHFRGFDEYYAIPFGEETAINGVWKQGPGMELFDKINEEVPKMRVIAEDLGYITETVKQLVKDTGYPGMKVIQFAFNAGCDSEYLPHNYDKNCVVYTGTHDNDTILGWFNSLDIKDQKWALHYLNRDCLLKEDINWDFIRLAMASTADMCIIPMQDYLGIGNEGRINMPSTLGGNWTYRMKKGQLTGKLADRIYDLVITYAR